MSSISQRLTKGSFWLAATRGVVNLTAFANTLVLARILVPEDFGIVALATTISAIIVSVTELSLTSALVHHSELHEDHFHTAWTLNFLRAAMVGLVVAALAVPIAHFYEDRRLIPIILIIAGASVIGGLTNPKLILLTRELVFWQEFVLGVSQKIVGLVVAVVAALILRSYWALIYSTVATQATALILSYVIKPYRPRLRLNRARELLSFSIWLTFAQLANTINFKFDQLIIGYVLGNSSLGYYSVGDTLAVLPTREATTPLAQTLFPGFVKLSGNPTRLQEAYQKAQTLLCAVGLPVGLAFAPLARPVILLTMGSKWLPAVTIVECLSCIFAIQTLASALQPLAMAVGRTDNLFGRDILILAVRLPLVFVGVLTGGLAGVVYARCVSGLISNWINMRMVRGLLDLPLRAQLLANSRSIMAVTLMTACMYLIGQLFRTGSPSALILEISAMSIVGCVTYVGATYTLWRHAGRPAGPEREVLLMVSRATALRTKWS